VDVLARDLPRETTSVVAAALWYPYKALPQDRVTAWAGESYAAFAELASGSHKESGVRMTSGTEAHHEQVVDPWWAAAVPDLEHVAPPPGYADAWSFTAPVIDMPRYLAGLERRLRRAGGMDAADAAIEQRLDRCIGMRAAARIMRIVDNAGDA